MGQVGDAELRRLSAEQGDVDQIQNALRRVAVAVHDLVQQIVGVLARADRRHTAVEIHSLLALFDVGLVDVRGDVEIGGALGWSGFLSALLLQNGLLQELEVHIIAHRDDVAGLLRAEQIARAANFEIAHGDLEAGAEFRVLADGLQPLFGNVGQDLAAAEGQIGKGVAAGPADAPANLMELGQTEPVRILDDEGVDVGDVDAGFDDRGADQDLYLAVGHPLHDVAQLVLVHLAVGHGDLGPRMPVFQGGRAAGDGLHAVVEIVDLAAARQLPADGVVQDRLVLLQDEGLDRVAVHRRLLDGGHIPDAGEGHIQRARDRGGGQG